MRLASEGEQYCGNLQHTTVTFLFSSFLFTRTNIDLVGPDWTTLHWAWLQRALTLGASDVFKWLDSKGWMDGWIARPITLLTDMTFMMAWGGIGWIGGWGWKGGRRTRVFDTLLAMAVWLDFAGEGWLARGEAGGEVS